MCVYVYVYVCVYIYITGASSKVVATGGLGKDMVPHEWEVWVCDAIENDNHDFACFTYAEEYGLFVPWGKNSRLKLFTTVQTFS